MIMRTFMSARLQILFAVFSVGACTTTHRVPLESSEEVPTTQVEPTQASLNKHKNYYNSCKQTYWTSLEWLNAVNNDSDVSECIQDMELARYVAARIPHATKYSRAIRSNVDFAQDFIRGGGCQAYIAQFQEGRDEDYDSMLTVLPECPRLWTLFARARRDKEIVLKGVKYDGDDLEFAVDELRRDPDVALAALGKTGRARKYVPESLMSSKEFIFSLLSMNPERSDLYEYLSPELQADTDIARRVVSDKHFFIQNLRPASMLKDHRVATEALNAAGYRMAYLTPAQQDDEALARVAVFSDNEGLSHVSQRLKDNSALVLQAVTAHGEALQHASVRLRNSPQHVQAALISNWKSFQYTEEGVRTNPKVIKAAIRASARNAVYLPCRMLNETAVANYLIAAVEAQGKVNWSDINLKYKCDSLTNPALMSAIARESLDSLSIFSSKHMPRSLLKSLLVRGSTFDFRIEGLEIDDPNLVLEAIAENPSAIFGASLKLLGSSTFRRKALKVNPASCVGFKEYLLSKKAHFLQCGKYTDVSDILYKYVLEHRDIDGSLVPPLKLRDALSILEHSPNVFQYVPEGELFREENENVLIETVPRSVGLVKTLGIFQLRGEALKQPSKELTLAWFRAAAKHKISHFDVSRVFASLSNQLTYDQDVIIAAAVASKGRIAQEIHVTHYDDEDFLRNLLAQAPNSLNYIEHDHALSVELARIAMGSDQFEPNRNFHRALCKNDELVLGARNPHLFLHCASTAVLNNIVFAKRVTKNNICFAKYLSLEALKTLRVSRELKKKERSCLEYWPQNAFEE